MQLEIRHLRLVSAIAEEGGVTKAAGRLHLTQSALSHQLREIEDRLGAPLFLRLNRRMVPTPAGERLVRSAGPLLSAVKRVEDEVGLLATGRTGVLRLATECYTCYHWVPAVLAEYARVRPGVEVQIVAGATQRPVDALLAGRLEVAVVSSPVSDPRVAVVPLFRDEMVAVMSPSHRYASRRRLRAEDFASEALVLYATPEDSTLYQRVLDPAGVKPRQHIQVQLTEAIVEMVKAGLGIGALARWAVARELANGSLVGVPVEGGALKRRWAAATLAGAAAPPYVGDFTRLLAKNGLRAVVAA
jgi:LysR family transcriptional regulator for metE and metH